MPFVQVMPAFARETLDSGAGEAGVLIGAAGFGSLFATVVLASLGNFPYRNWSLVAMVAEAFRWHFAISSGAAIFLLLSLRFGLIHPYLCQLTI
jgi:hypothetical protein